MTEELVRRLEAVTNRLERLAKKQGGGGGGDDEDDVPQYVTDFQALVDNQMKVFLDSADAVGAKGIRPILEQSMKNILDVVRANGQCSKPKSNELMDFLKETVNNIAKAEKLKMKRSKYDNHHSAFYETITSVSWVTMSPPYGLPLSHVKSQKEATQFHLNRILKKAKDSDDKEKHRAFVKALTQLHDAQLAIVKENFKTGLTWTGKKALTEFSGSSGSAPAKTAAPAAEEKEAPKAAPKAAAKSAPKKKGGLGGNFMAELKKKADGGDSAAVGMKKVTADMKTKNRKKDERSGKVVMKGKPKAPKKPAKPPVTKNLGGRWLMEYHHEGVVEAPDSMKTRENIFITCCQNCGILVNQKVKAITIDSCKKVQIQVAGVISSIELVNCKSVTLIVKGKVPAIQIDKSESPRIILLKEAIGDDGTIPNIVTSMITAGNIEIPGKTEEDDMIEIPFPEQFLNKVDLKTGKITCTPVTHG